MHYLLYSKNRNYKDKQNNTQNCFLKIILLFPVSFFANFTQRKKERKKKNKKQMRYYKKSRLQCIWSDRQPTDVISFGR